jgi:hypothetical protein
VNVPYRVQLKQPLPYGRGSDRSGAVAAEVADAR